MRILDGNFFKEPSAHEDKRKCSTALVGDGLQYNVLHEFIKLKTKGWLSYPSDDVLDICLVCEKVFRQKFYPDQTAEHTNLPYESMSDFQYQKLTMSVLSWFRGKPIFHCLYDHMLETDPLENHAILLIKAVSENYFDVRLFYASDQYTM